MFTIATEPLKKNKLSNVDLTNFLFFIPLPNTCDLNNMETKNQKAIKILFRLDQEV